MVYADPPSRFEPWDRETGTERAPDAHYDTMTLKQICGIKPNVAKNALLVIWVYDPMLPDAFEIARAWGFDTYVTVAFRWMKIIHSEGQYKLFDSLPRLNFGTGYHTRGGGIEECLLFKRGRGLPVLRHDIRREFYSPLREHSRKPDEVPGWLVDLYGDVPRLEMFARTTRPGWDAWGNELGKFNG